MKFLILIGLATLALAEDLTPIRVLTPASIKHPLLRAHYALNPRIVGGTEATPHSIKYQVGLYIHSTAGTNFCGGSLISRTAVLTAAHCAEISQTIEVVLGAHRIKEAESTQLRVMATVINIHPAWDSSTLQNDLAILRLPVSVELNENIGLVALPTNANNNYEGNLATSSGWGLDSDEATTISDVLRYITTSIGSNLVCNLYYFGVIQSTHICASGEGGKSTCSGDSGGPLVASTGEQIGIVSFGLSIGCAVGWPHVYTRVTSFLPWIQANSDV